MTSARVMLSKVLEVVSRECDVPKENIVGRCRDAESVDARWICVKLMSEHGYYPSRVAELMGITPRYVQYIMTDFEDRIALCRYMRNNYERARNKLRNLVETDV